MDLYDKYDPIRKYFETDIPIGMVYVPHGMAFNIFWDSHSSRTYIGISRMVLESL
jgi:hypothetical protein